MSRVGQAQSLTRKLASCPLTQALAESRLGASGTWGDREIATSVRGTTCPHSLGSPVSYAHVRRQARAGCALGEKGLPLQGAAAIAAHSLGAGSCRPRLSWMAQSISKGRGHGVHVHLYKYTPELVLAGPS